jgi:methanethiol S-methyltransferase
MTAQRRLRSNATVALAAVTPSENAMLKLFAIVYAVAAYAVGMASLVLFGAFLLGFDVLSRAATPVFIAFAVDIGLILMFGLQHSAMARPAFKQALSGIVPRAIERGTFVLASGLALGALLWFWRPIEGELWHVSDAGLVAVYAVFALGALILVGATFMIDHFELFGLKQAWRSGETQPASPEFRVALLYRLVRHPIMLGLLIMLWAAPHMTIDHLVVSLGLTAYILVALRFEERDLVHEHGQAYRQYQRAVPRLLPLPRPRTRAAEDEAGVRAWRPGA